MKSVLTFLGFVLCISLTYAQEIETSSLPYTVTDVFSLLYPDAKSLSWEKINDQYKAEFKNNKMATMALIAIDGTVLQTETQIRVIALPEPAIDYLEQKYVEEKIDMATIIENDKGIITFTAVLDKTDFTFDATGQLLDNHSLVLNTREKP